MLTREAVSKQTWCFYPESFGRSLSAVVSQGIRLWGYAAPESISTDVLKWRPQPIRLGDEYWCREINEPPNESRGAESDHLSL